MTRKARSCQVVIWRLQPKMLFELENAVTSLDRYVFASLNDDVIEWKHFPRYWPFVRGIHRSPHNGQWRRALMLSLIWARINGWVNTDEAGHLRRHRAHCDVIVMKYCFIVWSMICNLKNSHLYCNVHSAGTNRKISYSSEVFCSTSSSFLQFDWFPKCMQCTQIITNRACIVLFCCGLIIV